MVTHNGPTDGRVTLIDQSVPGKKMYSHASSQCILLPATHWLVTGQFMENTHKLMASCLLRIRYAVEEKMISSIILLYSNSPPNPSRVQLDIKILGIHHLTYMYAYGVFLLTLQRKQLWKDLTWKPHKVLKIQHLHINPWFTSLDKFIPHFQELQRLKFFSNIKAGTKLPDVVRLM